MQRIDLDFRKHRSLSPWLGWALLAVACVIAVQLGLSFHHVRRAVAEKENRLERLRLAPEDAARGRGAPAVTPEEVAVARDTIQRLAMPWNHLFRALESVPHAKVALLAIEPDAQSGTVLISGEAKDYPAALDYVSQLGHAKALSHVHLVRHEKGQNGPQQAVSFSVSASWSKGK